MLYFISVFKSIFISFEFFVSQFHQLHYNFLVQEVSVCSCHKHSGWESFLSHGMAPKQKEAGTDWVPRQRADGPKV